MIQQFDANYISSFLLYLDNKILTKGLAYTNYSGLLYKINSPYSNLYAYATPFKQLVNDSSISGANIMTGLYLNGNFVNVGQSGLYSINHKEGIAYFTSSLPTNTSVSGRYAIKDINLEITDQLEYKLIFDTKYIVKSKFNQVLSGLPSDTKTLPSIFLKVKNTDSKVIAFGGIQDNNITLRALVLADSEYLRLSVCNIMKSLSLHPFSLVNSTPFDYLGNYTGLDYNYNNLSFNTGYWPLIIDVKVKDIPLVREYRNLEANVSAVDFTLSTFWRPS